jgi:hypothetical protein
MRLALLWFASLVSVAMATRAIVTGQVDDYFFSRVSRVQTRVSEPQMVSGSDIGFRVDGTDRLGLPVGKCMVRVNGEWVEVSPSAVMAPAR